MRDALLVAFVAALFSACASQELRVYTVSQASRKDIAGAERIVRNIAAETHLVKDTEWTDFEVNARYMAPNVYLRALETWRQSFRIELSRMSWPPPKVFDQADRLLTLRLSEAFGRRLSREQHIGPL